jgi:Glycosyltransferase family 87
MRRSTLATVTGCLGLWAVARWLVFDPAQPGDTRTYSHVARMIDAGAIPYRDFDSEYPPLANGVFWLVGRVPGGNYPLAFSATMALCLVATALAGRAIARHVGLGPVRTAGAVGVIAGAPLILGTVLQSRYDLAVAAAVGWMVVAALHERFGWTWLLLAVAIALKLVPLLLIPVVALWHVRRRSPAHALRGLSACGAGVFVTFLPFMLVAPRHLWRLFAYHLDRPAEVESLGASITQVSGGDFARVLSYGSENLTAQMPDRLAVLSTMVLIVAVAAIAAWTWRGLRRGSNDTGVLVGAVAATVAAAVLLGKVISAQYLVWLLPCALLVPGIGGAVAAVVTVAAMGLTQYVFPYLFDPLVERGIERSAWVLLTRNLLLILLVALLWPRVRTTRPQPAISAKMGVTAPEE